MTLEQAAGKILLAAAIPAGLAVAGWLHNDMDSIHTAVNAHSGQLAGISQQMADLTNAVRDHNTTTDAALNKLLDDDQKHTAQIASEEVRIEDIRREAPREAFTPVPPRAPEPFPTIGRALSHIFSPPHRQWRRHP